MPNDSLIEGVSGEVETVGNDDQGGPAGSNCNCCALDKRTHFCQIASMLGPRNFRLTAWLCLAILTLDSVVSQLPHSHAHHSATCAQRHSNCSCSHECSHTLTCSHHQCENSGQAKPVETPTQHDGPCDQCTLCRHQAQAALTCTVVAPLLFQANFELLPDQKIAQLSPEPAHVYQGRGPPAWL